MVNANVLVQGVQVLSTVSSTGIGGVIVTTCGNGDKFFRVYVENFEGTDYDPNVIQRMKTFGFFYVSADDWEDDETVSHFKVAHTN